ncbi:hypothetical protein [Thalassospira lucentensis]|uniref:hypothetical protein n=1 Tax=Thalassospira lucentensis TaxID=168935 RepID=UPI003AA98976
MKTPDASPFILLLTGAITGTLAAALFFPTASPIPDGWGNILGSFLGVVGAFWVARFTFRMENRARIAQANQSLREQIIAARVELSMAETECKNLLDELEWAVPYIKSNPNSPDARKKVEDVLSSHATWIVKNGIKKAIPLIKTVKEEHKDKLRAIEISWINATIDFLQREQDFDDTIKNRLDEIFRTCQLHDNPLSALTTVEKTQSDAIIRHCKHILNELTQRLQELSNILFRLDNV